jgi:putative ABC transport system permease protein
MHTFLQDLRYGARTLVQNLGFTAAAVLCLALGVGATTAIFSVVNAVVVRPLPYAQPERLVRLYTEWPTWPGGGLHRFWTSAPEYLDLVRETKSWDSLDGWSVGGANVGGGNEPVRVTSCGVTGGLLKSLGVSPILGRPLTPEDDKAGAPLTAVLSYGLWQRAFGGDRGIVGRDIQFNGRGCTVVGVMPAGFQFPTGELDAPEIWAPLQIDPARPGGRGSHFLSLLGRLKPGVPLRQAQDELGAAREALGRDGDPEHPRVQPGDPRDPLVSAARRSGRPGETGHADADGRGRIRAADRLR